MFKKYNIAIVGATGNVGRELLNIISEQNFPVNEVTALASRDSLGKEVSFGDKILKIKSLDDFNFQNIDIVFSAPKSSQIARNFIPRATDNGCIIIDKSSAYRQDSDVPLVIPEVNGDEIAKYKNKNIIASPNCSVIPLCVALKPIDDEVGIKRIVVSSYQSVSGASKEAMDELFSQTRGMLMYHEKENKVFPKQIAFNVIPQIDDFMADGNTKEEWKIVAETQKILERKIPITVTAVRVPVFIGHALSVNIELEDDLTPEAARKILAKSPGITIMDEKKPGGYITPADIAAIDDICVSRIRRDDSVKHGLNMWVVGDNLRKGAALNAVQIADLLIKDYL
jgi:aspartate-semialdehyde dehydrogenase